MPPILTATDYTNFFVYNGHTYKAYNERVTWLTAKSLCEAKGGHLAVILSADVQAFIETFVRASIWIGGYKVGGVLQWVTGDPWSYSNFNTGEPNNPTAEPYIQIGSGNSFIGGKWNDWTASAILPYLCEWDKDLTGEDTYSGPRDTSKQWYSAPIKPFILRGKLNPVDETAVECKFLDDAFSPDFERDVRIASIPLIKGTAVQINRPSSSLHILQVGNGIFLSKADYLLFTQLYYSNLIGEPEPYPTDYLVLREEDLELELPNGYKYPVIFSDTPTLAPQKLSQGRWLYTVKCNFRIISDEDEQEEL